MNDVSREKRWTPLRLIEWTTAHFQKKGVPNPRLDAELLLAHSLNCKRIDLYLDHDKILNSKELSDYRALVRRRAAREPLQYIVGSTEFYGLTIKVIPDVLIPRPETELLVEEVLALGESLRRVAQGNPLAGRAFRPTPDEGLSRRQDPAPQILEIGTGSGCIAIALAKNIPNVHIDATERSAPALTVARNNACALGLAERIAFYEADLFPSQDKQYPLIVSNPPYVPSEQLKTVQAEIRDWEPPKALDGGKDGLETYRRIIADLPERLAPGGSFLGEIGHDQERSIRGLFEETGIFDSIEIKKDLSGHPRIIVAKRL